MDGRKPRPATMKHLCTNLLLSIALLPVISPASVQVATELPPEQKNPVERKIEPKGGIQQGKKDALDLWLDRLAEFESSNRSSVRIVDTNGKHSSGCLQFQDATLSFYSLRCFGKPNLDRIMDCHYQKALARRMLEDDPRNARHWYTSVYTRGLGEPPVGSKGLSALQATSSQLAK